MATASSMKRKMTVSKSCSNRDGLQPSFSGVPRVKVVFFGLLTPMPFMNIKPLFTIVSVAAALLLQANVSSAPIQLFDGRTFRGWTGDTNKTFRIEDHAIVAGNLSERIPRNEFLCTTRSFTNFILRLKFKLVGEGANGGVQIRTLRHAHDNEVSGYQADLGDPSWWGSLYDESRRNKVLAQADMNQLKRALRRNDWNDYVIRCEGRRIRLAINGVQTVDYTEPDENIPSSGIIAVQIHAGNRSEAWYKDITIDELP